MLKRSNAEKRTCRCRELRQQVVQRQKKNLIAGGDLQYLRGSAINAPTV